jgi:two-component system nitrate/nitrite response regulator NarL
MKILIADDHPLTLQGTVSYVEKMGHKVVCSCSNGKAALNYIQLHTPELAILDLNMPGLDGIEVAQKIFENKSQTKIVLLTMHNEISILNKAKEYNIYGYILKDKAFPELENCLKEIENGKKFFSNSMHNNFNIDRASSNDMLSLLTLSERKIIELIADKKTSKQIAELLFLSEKQ